MAERTIVAVVAHGELRIFERNGDNHAALIGQLTVRADLDSQAALTLALTVAEAAVPLDGLAAPPSTHRAVTPPPRRAKAKGVAVTAHDVLEWMAEHGSATLAELRVAFPSLDRKRLSNRLTALRMKGALSLKDGRYSIASGATPRPTHSPPPSTPSRSRLRAAKMPPSFQELYDWLRVNGPATPAEMYAAFPNTPFKVLTTRRNNLRGRGMAHHRADGTWAIGPR